RERRRRGDEDADDPEDPPGARGSGAAGALERDLDPLAGAAREHDRDPAEQQRGHDRPGGVDQADLLQLAREEDPGRDRREREDPADERPPGPRVPAPREATA